MVFMMYHIEETRVICKLFSLLKRLSPDARILQRQSDLSPMITERVRTRSARAHALDESTRSFLKAVLRIYDVLLLFQPVHICGVAVFLTAGYR